MSDLDLNIAVELHDIDAIRAILEPGNVEQNADRRPLIWILIGEYTGVRDLKTAYKSSWKTDTG